MGSISLNLIGGSSEERIEQNSDFFIINNENVSCTASYINTTNLLQPIQTLG